MILLLFVSLSLMSQHLCFSFIVSFFCLLQMFDLVCVLWVEIKFKQVLFFWVWRFVALVFLLVGIKFKWALFYLEEENQQNSKLQNKNKTKKRKEEDDHQCGFVQEKESVVLSVGLVLFKIFTTMSLNIVTQKLKNVLDVFSKCSV